MKRRVVAIDPGHGGADLGACGAVLREAPYVYSLALDLASVIMTQDIGLEVVLLRTTEGTDPPLAMRNARAKRAGAELVLSLHCNASPTKEQRGAKVFYWPTNHLGRVTAEHIARAMPDPLYSMRVHGEHAWPADSKRWPAVRAVCSAYAATCVLVECGHLDYEGDEAALAHPDIRRHVITAIRCGLHHWAYQGP